MVVTGACAGNTMLRRRPTGWRGSEGTCTSQRSTINLLQAPRAWGGPEPPGALGRRARPVRARASARARAVGPAGGLRCRHAGGRRVVRRRVHARRRLRRAHDDGAAGSGDLLRPWDDDVQFEPLPFSVVERAARRARSSTSPRAPDDGRGPLAGDATASEARHIRRARRWPSSARRPAAACRRRLSSCSGPGRALGPRRPGWGAPAARPSAPEGGHAGRRPARRVGDGRAHRPRVPRLVERVRDGWLLRGDPAAVLPPTPARRQGGASAQLEAWGEARRRPAGGG